MHGCIRKDTSRVLGFDSQLFVLVLGSVSERTALAKMFRHSVFSPWLFFAAYWYFRHGCAWKDKPVYVVDSDSLFFVSLVLDLTYWRKGFGRIVIVTRLGIFFFLPWLFHEVFMLHIQLCLIRQFVKLIVIHYFLPFTPLWLALGIDTQCQGNPDLTLSLVHGRNFVVIACTEYVYLCDCILN